MSLSQYFTVPQKSSIVLDARDVKALENLVEMTKERLWLSSAYPKRPSPSIDFEEKVTDHIAGITLESITVAENLIARQHSLRNNE